MNSDTNRRILVVDDQASIHDDFRKILSPDKKTEDLSHLENSLFGETPPSEALLRFEMDSAHQGQEGLARVEQALRDGRPYSLAFVDVRMPPGWDGVETANRLWQVCPDLQVVICTAYTDYSWKEMMQKLGPPDRWVILKKPFDNVEVLQLSNALTEKWNLNRQARLKLSELETMVEERTLDLRTAHERLLHEAEARLRMEEQLARAQKLESVGQLAAGVAHHFNNLLQLVVINSGLLLTDGSLTPGQQRALRGIESASRRAGNLTQQLLAFSRSQLMRPGRVDLNATLAKALAHLKPELNGSILVKLTPAPELPLLPADAAMLEQVLIILARNARDAMKQGGELDIRTERVTVEAGQPENDPAAHPGEYVCLSVSDTGAGMNAATVERLFEPFFTTKDLGQGIGLGLATAYGIVKQHHGWIQVSTRVNAGTTFRVFLPVTLDCAPDADTPVFLDPAAHPTRGRESRSPVAAR